MVENAQNTRNKQNPIMQATFVAVGKPCPFKLRDEVQILTVGSKTDFAVGTVIAVKQESDNSDNFIVTIEVASPPAAWLNRVWPQMRGFQVLVLHKELGGKLWANRNCRLDEYPERRGVSCENLAYALTNFVDDQPLFARFEYGLKGEFDVSSGAFGADYSGAQDFIFKNKKWHRFGGPEIPQ